MVTAVTNLVFRESARRERFEPTGGIYSTNTQKAIEEVSNRLPFVSNYGLIGTADDTAIVQNALNLSGNWLIFGPGTYTTTALSIPANKTIVLEPGAVIKAKAGIAGDLITIAGNNVTLEGVGTIDGNAQVNTNLINAANITGLSIRGLTFQNGGKYGINLFGNSDLLIQNNRFVNIALTSILHVYSGGDVSNIRIIDNYIDRSGTADAGGNEDGIYMSGSVSVLRTASRIIISRNIVIGKTTHGTGNGIELVGNNSYWPGYDQCSISDNLIYGFTLGISAGSSPSMVVANNEITASAGAAIEYGAVHGGVLSGNIVVGAGGGGGFLIDGGGNTDPAFNNLMTIVGNAITNVAGAGILVLGNVGRTVITGNTIALAGAGDGIRLQNSFAGETIISNNYLEGANVGSRAIESSAALSHPIYVTGNRISRWGTPALTLFIAGDFASGNIYDGASLDFISYVPTLTPTGGAFGVGAVTINRANYTRDGNLVTVFFDITIVDATGASGTAVMLLPLPWPAGSGAIDGCDVVHSKGLTGYRADNTHANITYYDGTTAIVTGTRWVGSLTYETAPP